MATGLDSGWRFTVNRLRRALIALTVGILLYPAASRAFRGDGKVDGGFDFSPSGPSRAPAGCVYTTSDYDTPDNAKYEMRKSPRGGFYYHYSGETDRASNNGGPLIVLVAGVPEPHYFDALRALLLEAHYRVLVLDLPGKEHTRLSGPPTAEYIFDQFQELWSFLRLHNEQAPAIVGTSISGPVTALMAARWAHQNPKLALVSALGMPREWPFVIRIGRIPLLSDLLAPFVLPGQVERNWKNGELLCPQNFPQLFKRQEMEFRGAFARINYLELAKALALADQTSVYQQVANTNIPVMLAYGDHDPFRDQVSQLTQLIPRAQVVTMSDSAHIIFVEQPGAIFKILDERLHR
jgi:pimeloyl-ACP methyl ester carboxylesterase